MVSPGPSTLMTTPADVVGPWGCGNGKARLVFDATKAALDGGVKAMAVEVIRDRMKGWGYDEAAFLLG
jgi:hypothetical protein